MDDINKVAPITPNVKKPSDRQSKRQDEQEDHARDPHSQDHADTHEPLLETEVSLEALALMIGHKIGALSGDDDDDTEEDTDDSHALDEFEDELDALFGDDDTEPDEPPEAEMMPPDEERPQQMHSPAVTAYEVAKAREESISPNKKPLLPHDKKRQSQEYQTILHMIDTLQTMGIKRIPFDWGRDPLDILRENYDAATFRDTSEEDEEVPS